VRAVKEKCIPQKIRNRAREIRHEDTRAEKLAWIQLRDRRMFGLKFRRQVPIDKFIVDFYCHELRLIVEPDGDVHDEPQQLRKDKRRDECLNKLGYKILRVANGLVMLAPDLFADEIRRFLPSPGASRHPLPEGEGTL
jgi:very-short-patch-repair endonuclease